MKKKIYINGRFLTQSVTGVQRYAVEIVKTIDRLLSTGQIDKERYQFVLLTPKKVNFSLCLDNITVRNVGRLKGHAWEQIELPFFSYGSLLINLCNTASIIKSKQILTIHDASIEANKNNYSIVFRIWYKLLYRKLPFKTKKIITSSKFSKQELIKYFPIEKSQVRVIYLGIDHILRLKSRKTILEELDLINKKFILAVSSINPNKNFIGIVDSLDFLDREDVEVVIVGSKDNIIYKSTKLFTSEQIKLVGYIEDEGLKTLYEHAECFVYPSYYEGFGLPPLEAMSCGCPVIVSNRASLPEVLGASALYCNPESAIDIASRINEILNDRNLKQSLTKKGLEHSKQFTWEKCTLELFKEIEEVLK